MMKINIICCCFLFVSLHNNNSNSVFDRTFYVFVGKRTLLNFTIKSQTQLLEQHFKAEKQIKSLIKGGLELIR